ncbi:type I polyketide synthase [Sorangium sp. So ce1097]|uniref:type I polyketide synthase n=1 Tax=Sorangium sp. So ce1097 TaxID=3133330 RepID=UPI003F603C27
MSDGRAPDAGERFDVAVIGMACHLPRARDVEAFWRNLIEGVEAVTRFSPDELRARGVPPELIADPDYVPAGVVLDGHDAFDAAFFGYPPLEAQILDPQQRIFLECAWLAFEDAGHAPSQFDGIVGVFAGATINTYLASNLLRCRRVLDLVGEQQLMLANDKDFLPLRVSHKLDLRGPSYAVQSACSTSLLSVHVACRALLSGECDMALAGGASVRVPQGVGYLYREGGTASRDGHCRAFDARASGSVAGSGAGAVVLRRLSDALRDGDAIRAIIKGTATMNDGAVKAGFAAPSVEGQARAIAEALSVAGVTADEISYVEAHGTATRLGDPIEVQALTRAFRRTTDARGYCALGSVKTNIGHLDAAAGISGLIKTTLALEHGILPATLNFERPSPDLDLPSTPFHVVDRTAAWESAGKPRRACVNSIGMGGSNVHVVLEEAPAPVASGPSRAFQILPLSARTPSALDAAAERLSRHLGARPDLPLADVAFTLQRGRAALPHRRAIVARSVEEAVAELGRARGHGAASAAGQAARPILFLFPGQGTQYAAMGAELYREERVFRDALDRCARHLRPHLGLDLVELLSPPLGREAEMEGRLRETALAQPALFAVEYALATLLASWGVEPGAMIGHSLGEIVAACLAGVMRLEDALALVAERGRLMQALPPGRMLAVKLAEPEVRRFLDDSIALACVNALDQCVLSGPPAAVDALEAALSEAGVGYRALSSARAFHSAMMDPAIVPMRDAARKIDLRPPQIPVFSTMTGRLLSAEEAQSPDYWAAQLRRPVRFADAAREALRERAMIPLEVGPGRALTPAVRGLAAGTSSAEPIAAMRGGDERRPEALVLAEAIARLWVAGGAVDFARLHAGTTRRRLSLPGYPFERVRAWIDPDPEPRAAPVEPAPARPPAAQPPAAQPPAAQPPAAVVQASLGATITVLSDRIIIQTGQGAPAAASAELPARPAPVAVGPVPTPAAPPPAPAKAPEDVEETVASFVSQLLGIPGVDRRARLLDLGADSLSLTQLLSRLRRTLQVDISMDALVEAGSVERIAALVRKRAPAPTDPASGDEDIASVLEEIERLSPDEAREELSTGATRGKRGERDGA